MYRVEELTWEDFKKLVKSGVDTLVIPVGSIEGHGKHLPLGTDCVVPEKLAEEVARELNAFLAPPIYYGVTTSLLVYPGTVSVPEDVFEKYVYSVLSSFVRHGVKYEIVINGHGGNIRALGSAAKRLWLELGARVLVVNWWLLIKDEECKSIFGQSQGHGGIDETAMVLAVRKDLVKKEREDLRHVYRVVHGAVVAYPEPASVLKYSDDEWRRLVPSEDEARKFYDLVRDRVVAVCKEFVEKLRELERC